MPETYKNLIAETLNKNTLRITLNRPEAANALNTELATEIAHLFGHINTSEIRCVVLTGAGKHFCAGADLKSRKGMSEKSWHEQHHALEQAQRTVLNCPLPVIAAVNGAAMGGGLELALACDFIYAADSANFGLTETTLGIMPGMGGTQTLPRRIGAPRAAELMYLGKRFSAAEALQYGLLNGLFAAPQLMPQALATAQAIAQNAPLAIKAVKMAMRQGLELPILEALACELKHYNTLLNTADRQEGINAFNEKRKAHFTGN